MKRFLVIIIAVTAWVVSSIGYADENGNLVVNPSFEQLDANNALTGWRKAYKGGDISTAKVLDGKQSLAVSSDMGGLSTVIKVPEPGCKLLIKANIYIEDFKQGIIKPIHLSFKGKEKTYYPHINLYPGRKDLKFNQWVEYKYLLDLSKHPEVDAFILWCIVWPDGKKNFTGKVYWDKLSVEVVRPQK